MRIIGGNLRGQKIFAPKGIATRPTSDRVREAIFNVVKDFEKKNVLDLFAGSGSLSFEALSRGAEKAFLVEKCKEAREAILKNTIKLRLEDKTQAINISADVAIDILAGKEKFDIIFIDPPYAFDIERVKKIIQKIVDLSLLNKDGMIVFEYSAKNEIKDLPLKVMGEKKYGDTKVSFLKL